MAKITVSIEFINELISIINKLQQENKELQEKAEEVFHKTPKEKHFNTIPKTTESDRGR